MATQADIEARERRRLPTRKRHHRRRKGLDYEDDDPEPVIGPGNDQQNGA